MSNPEAGLFDKGRSLVLMGLHKLLDAGQDAMGTVAQCEQAIRDTTEGRNKLDDLLAATRARRLTLTNQIGTAQAHIDLADQQIDQLLGDDDPSNDHLATPLQIQLDSQNELIKRAKVQLQEVDAEVVQYEQMVQRLDVKLSQAKGKLSSLRILEADADKKAKVAKLLSGITIGADIDTSEAEARLQEQAAVADNQLQRSIGQVAGAVGGATAAEASAAATIAARRQRLAAAKQTTAD